MLKRTIRYYAALSVAAVSLAVAAIPPVAGSAADWTIYIGPSGPSYIIGTEFGINPSAQDGYDGDLPFPPKPDSKGVQILLYKDGIQDPAWPVGFYGGDYELTPIAAGGSKTWSGIYLWAQNYTPVPENKVRVMTRPAPFNTPPSGYRGHLVLDYVPDSCNYTGPMDFWVDLTQTTELALPIPVVTDPLQGTKMHLTVYAPVPEPSSLAALACGLMGIGGFALRRSKC